MLRRRRRAPEVTGLAAPRSAAEADAVAADLDAAVDGVLRRITSLSDLTAALAIDYLQRVGRATPTLTPESGAALASAGYAAHMAIEEHPEAYGVTSIPVLGTLPDLRGGRPPQDLLLRLVKAAKKPFFTVCALDEGSWDAFVRRRAGRLPPELDPAVAPAVLRIGWLLRQVDLRYGLAPEPA